MARLTRPALAFAVAVLAALALAGPAGAHGRSYGATTLTLDPGAVAALTSLGVTPAPIAPARAKRNGDLAFPITNRLTNVLRTGVIKHSGGISLTAGATTVELTNFWIDPFRRQLTADVGGSRAPILDLDFSHARVSGGFGRLTLGPVGGALTDVAAGALDGAFGLPAGTVPAGLKLGDATVRYRAGWGWGWGAHGRHHHGGRH
jgi:hypothetical protein